MAENLRDKADSLARSAVAMVADAACDETTKLRAAIEQKDQIIAGLLEAADKLQWLAGLQVWTDVYPDGPRIDLRERTIPYDTVIAARALSEAASKARAVMEGK